ncbi:PepSY-associated TM helix domain-containing protein [Roseateles sp.]|uniref:PepSY-associated TM helix domain-containing protein n=1 Tax=Roseateles sp. TaxID=1971397 RepID=UPI0031D9AEB2
MNAKTLKTWLSVHSGIGIAAGLLLFIAFYAGALTLFHHEIEAWSAAAEPPAGPPPTLADAQRLLDGVLAQAPKMAADIRLQLPHDGHGLRAYGQDPATKAWRSFELGADGQPREQRERGELGEFIYRLHYTVGIPGAWGTYTMGVVSLLYGLALVSGLVIYLPVLARDLFALRWGRNLKRLWQDAHNAVGLLSLPFHIVFAWSGAVLCIGTLLLAPFQFLVFEGKLLALIGPQAGFSRPVQASGKPASPLNVEQLVAAATRAAPGLEVERLHIRHHGDAAAQVEADGVVRERHLSGAARVELSGITGALLHPVQRPATYGSGTALLRGLQTLHYGDFGGLALRWVYFVLALAGAFLFYSGNLLWVESRRKHQQAAQPRRASVMARLTLGVALGCIAGISALFVGTRVLGPDRFADAVQPVYFAVLGLCVLWALVRPLPKAAFELCVAAAALTGCIALADAAMLGPRLLRGDLLLWTVDLTALLGAALLLLLARATRHRARNGAPHSVWALGA